MMRYYGANRPRSINLLYCMAGWQDAVLPAIATRAISIAVKISRQVLFGNLLDLTKIIKSEDGGIEVKSNLVLGGYKS